ncbi:MAG: hypothetical protein IGS39_09480 [Calothrix sp. C42_A2020_038]|nr:hypothetical protein [Calothrix sp. C42_A2020_038]
MLTITRVATPVIRASKIAYKSPYMHPLARFVTEEAVAIMFGIQIEQIQRVDCYCYMVYVHANHISKFVSYADFPPPPVVGANYSQVFWRWRRRWRKRWNRKFAPDWWQNFYINQIQQSFCDDDLLDWWKVLILIKSALSDEAWQKITQAFQNTKGSLKS